MIHTGPVHPTPVWVNELFPFGFGKVLTRGSYLYETPAVDLLPNTAFLPATPVKQACRYLEICSYNQSQSVAVLFLTMP